MVQVQQGAAEQLRSALQQQLGGQFGEAKQAQMMQQMQQMQQTMAQQVQQMLQQMQQQGQAGPGGAGSMDGAMEQLQGMRGALQSGQMSPAAVQQATAQLQASTHPPAAPLWR